MRAMDPQEPHLRTLLSFIGIPDIDFILADKLALGPDVSASSTAKTQMEITDSLYRREGLVE